MPQYNTFATIGLVQQLLAVIAEDENYVPSMQEVSAASNILLGGGLQTALGMKLHPGVKKVNKAIQAIAKIEVEDDDD